MTQHDQTAQTAADESVDDPVDLVEVLVVRIAGERYGVEVDHAGRVVDLATTQAVPNTPGSVVGVGRVESSVTVLIDVVPLLADVSRDHERDPAGEYLVSDRGEHRHPVAIRIDGVEGMETYPLAAVEPPDSAGKNETFLRGVVEPEEAEALPLLDVEAVLLNSVEGIDTGELGSQPE